MRKPLLAFAAAVLAAVSVRAQSTPCAGKIVKQKVVETAAAGGYTSSTLQIENVGRDKIAGTLTPGTNPPVGAAMKAFGARSFTLAPGGIYSVYIAVSRPTAGVSLVYDSEGLPAKTIAAKVSGCSIVK